jgi:hypothetical protein
MASMAAVRVGSRRPRCVASVMRAVLPPVAPHVFPALALSASLHPSGEGWDGSSPGTARSFVSVAVGLRTRAHRLASCGSGTPCTVSARTLFGQSFARCEFLA